jgi:hypothetical protein
MDETILDYVKRRLREVGHSRWDAVSAAAGVASSLPRKIVYGDRANPGVQTVQPLLDYFRAVDRGELVLPERPPRANARAAAMCEADSDGGEP